MHPKMVLLRVPVVTVIALSIFTVSTSATPSSTPGFDLFARADTCGGNTALSQCGSNLPKEFCCPTEATCMPINGSTAVSVICCPKGADCTHIQPVPCGMDQYNATVHPENQIHIANTTEVKLSTCGTACCPLGYACNGNLCVASNSSPTSPPSGTPTPSSISRTEPPAASQTSPESPLPKPQEKQSDSGFPAKAVVAGFFPGMLLGALLTLLLLWVIKKRRETQKNRYSGDFGHVSRSISDPIYDPEHAARVDFIRHNSIRSESSTARMVQNGPGLGIGTMPGGGRVRSFFSKSPRVTSPTSPLPMPAPPPAIRAGDHRDPYLTPTGPLSRNISSASTNLSNNGIGIGISERPGVSRSGSTETIDVAMPTGAESFLQAPPTFNDRERRMTTDSTMTTATTFTKLMAKAGYEKDERDDVRQGRWK